MQQYTLSHYRAECTGRNMQYCICNFFVINKMGRGCINPLSWKTENCLSCITKFMATYGMSPCVVTGYVSYRKCVVGEHTLGHFLNVMMWWLINIKYENFDVFTNGLQSIYGENWWLFVNAWRTRTLQTASLMPNLPQMRCYLSGLLLLGEC